MRKLPPLLLTVFLLPACLFAQDFILEGCFWSCPGEADPAKNDLTYWSERLVAEAPELSKAGFTYLWLSIEDETPASVLAPLAAALRTAGLEPVVELGDPSGAAGSTVEPGRVANLNQAALAWNQQCGIRDFCLPQTGGLPPETTAGLLQDCCAREACPNVIFSLYQAADAPRGAAEWVREVLQRLGPASGKADPRIFDYGLREALRRATLDAGYDLRQVFRESIRDATALSGFNIVTGINGRRFRDQNGQPGDADDPVVSPLLAYAYLLTNNQLGLPVVAYADYAGLSPTGNPDPRLPLQHEIDQLLLAHQRYLVNSTSLEYLNREDSPRRASYLSAGEGAGPDRVLLFQLDGANTPAGVDAGYPRDVIVAINFADTTLRVVQEINMANTTTGDRYTDVLRRSGSSDLTVYDDDTLQVPNAVLLEVPARSYSLWVKGEAPELEPALIDLQVRPLQRYVELSWEAPAEIDVKGYAVERSVNGRPYEQIHWEKALGAGLEGTSYLYLDEDVYPEEDLYYRIKMVNEAGTYEHSTVEQTRLEGVQLNIRLIGGRDAAHPTLQIRSSLEEEAELIVFNAEGLPVIRTTHRLRPGLNRAEIDLSGLPPGVYFVNLRTQRQKRWSERMVKY